MKQERVNELVLARVQHLEEVNCGELAKELGCKRKQIFDAADDLVDFGFHLHVADRAGGVYERPKKSWTLFRGEEA